MLARWLELVIVVVHLLVLIFVVVVFVIHPAACGPATALLRRRSLGRIELGPIVLYLLDTADGDSSTGTGARLGRGLAVAVAFETLNLLGGEGFNAAVYTHDRRMS